MNDHTSKQFQNLYSVLLAQGSLLSTLRGEILLSQDFLLAIAIHDMEQKLHEIQLQITKILEAYKAIKSEKPNAFLLDNVD
jgi:hypothetical protein